VQCSGCQPGQEVEVVLCYPANTPIAATGVTRGAVEFITATQEAASELAPGFASLATMRAAVNQGTRFYYSQAAGLLFVRVQQAAGWGGAPPAGYCPPGGCSWAVITASAAAAAPAVGDCEARLAAEPGGAPDNPATDPFLSAVLAAPKFDLAAACPGVPALPMCDCYGWVGCSNRACTSTERMACDARWAMCTHSG
jgi:hypothetical protein